MSNPLIRVGVSACLLGQEVRYDGNHKRNSFVADVLGQHCRLVPICPEVEVGMSVPREAVRLEGDREAPRMIGIESGTDWTARMNKYVSRRVRRGDVVDLSGYVLKKGSPSCGMQRVKLFGDTGRPRRQARGLFASALIQQYPLLPVEEEGRLNDSKLREYFIVRVFAYHRLRGLFKERFNLAKLARFHTNHKYLLLTHSLQHYKLLDQLVDNARWYKASEIRPKYGTLFMEALKVKSTARKNISALGKILRFLRNHLTSVENRDILRVMEDYRKGLVPLIVPLTLVRHHVNTHGIGCMRDQVYLYPHPKELMLRNHV